MKRILFLSFVISLFLMNSTIAQDESRLLRFPTIYDNQLVFSYAGDLYSVNSTGGLARKLTSHPGYEVFPKFSPDGKVIAFTGQYDGNTEVFTIPAAGGTPKRLTYTATLGRDDISDRMGPNNIVMAWTPDGKNITYRSRKQTFNDFVGQLYNVPVDGGLSDEVPLIEGGFCSYSADGKQMAFNRVFREFRTWKHYQGGMADDIWIYDMTTKQITNITSNQYQDIIPMWIGDEIYFLSDRDWIMNLFVYNTKTKETSKVTNFDFYDIKFPSKGKDQIVFENGGFIYKLDTKSKKYEKISITIADDQEWARNEIIDASKRITSNDLSANGERVLFSARGEIFTVPYKTGITRNLTNTSGVHERDAVWSPDDKYIAYLSDATGEYEIYIQKQDGSEPAKQITTGSNTYIFSILWSPDSKKIAWNDRKLRLRYVDIETKKVTEVKQAQNSLINNFDWSPDSKWIAYAENDPNLFSVIRLYQLETAKTYDVTDNWYDSFEPTFSNDGKYLFFSSSRDFDPVYSETEWNHAYHNMGKVYFVTLAKATKNPLGLVNNEVDLTEKPKDTGDKTTKEGEPASETGAAVTVTVDVDGINGRIVALTVEASNCFNIYAIGNKVYYNKTSSDDENTSMHLFNLEEKEETALGDNIEFVISSNGKKMLVKKDDAYSVIDLPSAAIKIEDKVDVLNMKVMVDYSKEWKQIFDESWRQMRDFFYVPNMHGLDWKAIHDKYAVMLPYVKHRKDLTYLIGEMIGELNIGHAYVNTGDCPKPQRIKMGLLGAKVSRDVSGFYKIDEILKGTNWSAAWRSPLTEIGVDVKEGDYIIAVNGQLTSGMADIYASLQGTADKQVELTLNSKSALEGSRKVIVSPIADESNLYYYNWIQRNIEKVDSATNGEVGYIHIPDMGTEGLNEFVKYFYPQLDKKALIIDDRGNGGGNVSPMIIERLRRELDRARSRRDFPNPYPVPNQIMLGPKVLLINKYSASDGDLFAYSFKHFNLGTVIGTRTWGGVTGISGSLPFIDGGDLRKPEFSSYSADTSAWVIEGYGVEPDIYLDNDPHKEYLGIDDQLNKAIELIKVQMKDYKGLPDIPPAPDKSGKEKIVY